MRKVLLLLASCLSISGIIAQEPVADSSFFTPTTFFEQSGLKQISSNQLLRVYSKQELSAINRVVDIRWVFNTSADAQNYFNKNLEKEAEGGYAYKKAIALPNAVTVKVFREDPFTGSIYSQSNLINVHWYYIFLIDRVMVKVFTAGSNTSLSDSYRIAYEAASTVSSQLKLPVPPGPETFTGTGFQGTTFTTKLKEGNIEFLSPAGFESVAIPASLQPYFDHEVQLPGEDWAIRYYIAPYSEANKEEDALPYPEYCKIKKAKSSSVSLNIMMQHPGNMPPGIESKDTAKCRKDFNGDFMLVNYSEVGRQSELAKGYKFCYMYSIFKRGAADCFVIHLVNNPATLKIFPQLVHRSLRYAKQ